MDYIPNLPLDEMQRLPLNPGGACILMQPLLICIPEGGITVGCPVHGSHRLVGHKITC